MDLRPMGVADAFVVALVVKMPGVMTMMTGEHHLQVVPVKEGAVK